MINAANYKNRASPEYLSSITLQVLAAASENVWKVLEDAGKTASLLKCLLYNHEDPSSIMSTHVKRWAYHPRVGEAETEGSLGSLNSHWSQIGKPWDQSDPVIRNKVEGITRCHPQLSCRTDVRRELRSFPLRTH